MHMLPVLESNVKCNFKAQKIGMVISKISLYNPALCMVTLKLLIPWLCWLTLECLPLTFWLLEEYN